MRIPIPAWHYNYYEPAAPGDPPVPEPGGVVPPAGTFITFRYGLAWIGVVQAASFAISNYLNDAAMAVNLAVTGAASTTFTLNGSFTSSTGHVPGGTYSAPDNIIASINANSLMYFLLRFTYAASAPLPTTFYPYNNQAGVHGLWQCKTESNLYYANIVYKLIP